MKNQEQYYLASDPNCYTCQLSSPPSSRTIKNCISFANMRNLPKQCDPQRCPSSNTKVRKPLAAYKQNIISPPKSSRRQTNHIVEAYELQNRSLRGTIDILKDQIEALSSSYKSAKQKGKKLKKQLEEVRKKNEQQTQNLQRYKQKNKQYDELVPKIEELQSLQDKILDQNDQLKKRQTAYRETIANIMVIMGNNRNQIFNNIRTLIRKTCSQF